jgi:hypothetical protein
MANLAAILATASADLPAPVVRTFCATQPGDHAFGSDPL